MIKGGGGALLREKILAYNSNEFIVIVDDSKLVQHLGKFSLPVEIVPFGVELILRNLAKLECKPAIRKYLGANFLTDNGNYIADCDFGEILDPDHLDDWISAIPGVVENGLFSNLLVKKLIVGYENGEVRIMEKSL
jgi:ribose 5-phosphate isomerase A